MWLHLQVSNRPDPVGVVQVIILPLAAFRFKTLFVSLPTSKNLDRLSSDEDGFLWVPPACSGNRSPLEMFPASHDSEEETLAARAGSKADAGFDRWRRVCGAVLAPVGLGATWLLTAGSLQPAGRATAAVLVAVAVLWMTEPIPLLRLG